MVKLSGLLLAVVALVAVSSVAIAAPVVPGSMSGGVEPTLNLRFFLKQKPLSYFAELSEASQTDHRQYEGATLGAYYRLMPGLTVGGFYRREYGLRHDGDWKNETGTWAWSNTNSRGEDSLILDVTPRLTLDFLPGENWVAELKTRSIFNTFSGEKTLTLRPGLTYFWLKENEPFLNFFLQYEIYFPLNYGVQTIYQSWLYLGTLYHWSHSVQAGLYGALKSETWGGTPGFVAQGGAAYSVTARTFVVGAVAVFQLTGE